VDPWDHLVDLRFDADDGNEGNDARDEEEATHRVGTFLVHRLTLSATERLF
jgi:hypothetical protein